MRARTWRTGLGASVAVSAASLFAVTDHAVGSGPEQSVHPAKPGPEAKGIGLESAVDGLWARMGDLSGAGKGAGSLEKIAVDADMVFRTAIAYGPIPVRERDAGGAALIRAAAVRRLAMQLLAAKDAGTRLRPLLASNPGLATTLAMSVRPEDDVPGVYARLGELESADPGTLTDKLLGPGGQKLAAAICVVFDRPRGPVGDGAGSGPASAAAVFDHFRDANARLVFRPERLPVDLLIWMVDARVSRDELRWALGTHAGNRTVGRLFDTITYDTDHLKRGATKKIIKTGAYTLQNIKRVGGVCQEQAFFASEVGKAIGVPTAMVFAAGSDVAHVWVGYLDSRGRWDFTEGRGDGQYEDLAGRMVHPQTQEGVGEGSVALSAGLLETDEPERMLAVALMDGASMLEQASGSGDDGENAPVRLPWPPAAPEGVDATPRAASAAVRLSLLDAAGRASPYDERVWRAAAALASEGAMSSRERTSWGEAALRACGTAAPDFAMEILGALFRGETDANQQSRMWDWAAQKFQTRPDLASTARLAQGDMWAQAQKPAKAWDAYYSVIERYANDGKMVMSALSKCERLLRDQRKEGAVLGLYESAFRRVSRPGSLGEGFWRSSNYFQIGTRYADLLRAAGRGNDAERVERQVAPKKDVQAQPAANRP